MVKKKLVLVTGGLGFIGKHLIKRLLEKNYKVLVIDNLSTGSLDNLIKGTDFIKGNLGEKHFYKRLSNKIQPIAVFHLAGQSSGELSFHNPLADLKSHVMSTFYLLDWCKKNKIHRFLYTSSMASYGDPLYLPIDEKHPQTPKTFYAAAKIAAEAYIKFYQNFGINTTIFRLFSVYGPGQNLQNKFQGMVSIYLSFLLENNPIIVKGSNQRYRDFVYIDDVITAFMLAFNRKISSGKIYNVASGKKTTVARLIETLKELFQQLEYPVVYKPKTPGDQFGIIGDNRLIRKELKWEPRYTLEQGLKEMIKAEYLNSRPSRRGF